MSCAVYITKKSPHQQDKLIRVLSGEIYDVVVDIRKSSNTFGQWHGEVLSAINNNSYGFQKALRMVSLLQADDATVMYKTTQYYYPESERTIKYDDPDLNIQWPIEIDIVSKKDMEGLGIKDML